MLIGNFFQLLDRASVAVSSVSTAKVKLSYW